MIKQFKTKKEMQSFIDSTKNLKWVRYNWDDLSTDFEQFTKEEIALETKKKNEVELVKKLGGDSQINALAKFVNVFAEEFAKQNPESKTAGMLQIVNETLNKE